MFERRSFVDGNKGSNEVLKGQVLGAIDLASKLSSSFLSLSSPSSLSKSGLTSLAEELGVKTQKAKGVLEQGGQKRDVYNALILAEQLTALLVKKEGSVNNFDKLTKELKAKIDLAKRALESLQLPLN